jgi:hypothetical protein
LDKFLDNKYTRWYYNIIDHRKKNIFEGYTENHHIIPSCMGGSNKKDNLIRLTAREHFICHLLLVKMVDSKTKSKLIYALNRMLSSNDDMRRYCPSSRIYKNIRENISLLMKEKWKDNSFMENHKIRNSKRWDDAEYRQRMTEIAKKTFAALRKDADYIKMQKEKTSRVSKNNWKNPEFRKKQIEERKSRWQNPEYKEKMRQIHRENAKDPEKRKKFKEMNIKANKVRWFKTKSDNTLEDFFS